MKLCLALLVLTAAGAQAAETLRVAPGESLEQAIAQARTAPKPVAIELRGGMYFLDKPMVLGPQDSGLTLAAFGDEKPILSGGRRITGWRLGADQVWTAAAAGDFRELWVNGRRAARARYPSQRLPVRRRSARCAAGRQMGRGSDALPFQGRRPESVALGYGRGGGGDEPVG